RLAVRAGDAGDAHAAARVIVETRRPLAHRAADVAHANRGRVAGALDRALRDDGGGPSGERVADELVPVAARAGNGEEDEPGLPPTRIVGEPRNCAREIPICLFHFARLQEHVQLHRVNLEDSGSASRFYSTRSREAEIALPRSRCRASRP